MIKRQYSGNERRARNYIWNAAGRYDFEPSFLAFSPDGSPDMYYNLVIGLAYKWLDMEAIQEFIKRYSASRSAEEFDDLFWLGLENCVYEKEIGERPVLEKLRREKAEAWFKSAADMSRQQMEMQSMTVYEQQMIRWSEVLGRFCHTGKRSLALAGRLLFSGSLDAEGAVGEMTGILLDFFRTDISRLKEGGERKGILSGLSLPGLTWKAPRQRLFLTTGDGRGDLDTNVRLHECQNVPQILLRQFTGTAQDGNLHLRSNENLRVIRRKDFLDRFLHVDIPQAISTYLNHVGKRHPEYSFTMLLADFTNGIDVHRSSLHYAAAFSAGSAASTFFAGFSGAL